MHFKDGCDGALARHSSEREHKLSAGGPRTFSVNRHREEQPSDFSQLVADVFPSPPPPRVRIFCVGAHRKSAWAQNVEQQQQPPSSHIKPPLCVCLFASSPAPVSPFGGGWSGLKKKKEKIRPPPPPKTSSSLRHTEVCRNAVSLWIFSLLTLKRIFWKLPKTAQPPRRRARGCVDIVVQQNTIVSGGFQQRTGLTTALSPAKVFIFSLFTVQLNGFFLFFSVIEPCIPTNTLSFMS